jgi:S-adenosylmethionine:tRNA ribosyltransferase-isomerase
MEEALVPERDKIKLQRLELREEFIRVVNDFNRGVVRQARLGADCGELVMALKLEDFDYRLPKSLIAQSPMVPRNASNLMVLGGGEIEHRKFYGLVDYLEKGDVLVVNNSKVLPARLFGRKSTGGKVECLVVEISGKEGMCLLRGKNIRSGTKLSFEDRALAGGVKEKVDDKFVVEFDSANLKKVLNKIGRAPTPPYIKKLANMHQYQTVYAKNDGSIAAPTAGLHFTDGLLKKIEKKGVKIANVTLHVGLGTFAPVKENKINNHEMEAEFFKINKKDAEKINNRRGRLIAVGTTTVKTLESACDDDGTVMPASGPSDLFIYPGYKFKAPIDALLTNFHLPKSTLLMLVCAYAGKKEIFEAYELAVKQKYRFYSFGDAMLINHGAVD